MLAEKEKSGKEGLILASEGKIPLRKPDRIVYQFFFNILPGYLPLNQTKNCSDERL